MSRRKVIFLVLAMLLVGSIAPANGAELLEVNGYLHEVQDQRVLHVWGTHYEMGYAQGYILAEEIMEVFHGYVLELLPKTIYMLAHWIVPPLFEVPEVYLEEAQGILDGMRESSVDTFIPSQGRHLNVNDLILGNAVGDLGAMACSTQMIWNQGTASDPRLKGETAFIRNLDWALAGPDPFLLPKRTIVMVYTPTQPGTQTVVSVTFPGYFACLTCMNEQGVVASLNIAHNGIPMLDISFAERFVHIGFSMRQALESADVNGDNSSTMQDVVNTIQDSTRSGAFVVTLAEPRDRTIYDPAVVLEADNAGVALRKPKHEPDLPAYVLLATNHLRLLHKPESCDRYETLREKMIEREGRMTLEDMWDLEAEVLQDRWLSTTAQTVYFIPSEREMGVAYTTDDAFSPEKEPAILPWEVLAELPEGVDLPQADDDDDDSDAPSDDDDDDSACCG